MRRISITKLFSLLPHSANTSFSLSHSEPSPFTTLPALYLRLESTRHLSLELVHGKKNQEILTIDVRANDLELGYEDSVAIKALVRSISSIFQLPVIVRPIVLAFLTHLYSLGPECRARSEDLQSLIEGRQPDAADNWFNTH